MKKREERDPTKLKPKDEEQEKKHHPKRFKKKDLKQSKSYRVK